MRSRDERQEQESGKDNNVNRALHHRCAAGRECDGRDEERECQEHEVLGSQPQLQGCAEEPGGEGHRRDGEADGGQRRAEREVEACLLYTSRCV